MTKMPLIDFLLLFPTLNDMKEVRDVVNIQIDIENAKQEIEDKIHNIYLKMQADESIDFEFTKQHISDFCELMMIYENYNTDYVITKL